MIKLNCNQVATYLDSFGIYQWLWQDDKDQAYKDFITTEPSLEDYDRELKRFSDTADEINAKPSQQRQHDAFKIFWIYNR